MTTPDPAAEGRLRAEKLLAHLSENEDDAAEELLAGLTEVRDLVFVGAGLTAIARAEGRTLPTAQRAQASTRQLKLGQLRDSHRDDPEGLRTWLRRSGEEILLIRSLQAAVARLP
ncbi:hypothetical protein [Blastococcus sp. TF02A-35]|uniref:hypothetical protein n=1 Tax=Blastococcus sp. TF02A-35 TaxID=2559612 RepID=UPI0010739DA7|nr:hypothetical protein [Blastococcus sp. TF02A_35]TFV52666.1 hypothetical protein E4P43_05030 [Blastococcus sp. TF02A_35]